MDLPTTARYALFVPVLASLAWSTTLFAEFIAEDAYILYRYAENVFHQGALVYNAGERINALTSPLHAFLTTVLYALTRDCATTGKVAGFSLLLATACITAWRHRADPPLAACVVALVALPTCMVLWAFGGLETPWLMFLATIAALQTLRPDPTRPAHTYLACAFAGVGFLGRYDAALFFAPLALHALLRQPMWRHRCGAAAAGAALPLAWLTGAYLYYGDFLPTSFHIKPPGLDVWTLRNNAIYVLAWLFLTGLLPALLVWILQAPMRRAGRRLAASLAAGWPIYAGLALELAYALSVATTHMMFSFRIFVPYLPAAAVVIAEAMRADRASTDARARAGTASIAAFVLLAAAGHAGHAWYTYDRSVNGLSPTGEFQRIGVRDWMGDFMEVLWAQADALRRDWPTRPAGAARAPRINTYAGGVVPYAVPDAYVYEPLASFRHGEPRYRDFNVYADYGLTVSPLFGPLERQVLHQPGRFELVFERTLMFDGQMQTFLMFFNRRPEPHPLGDRVDRRHPPNGPATVPR